MLKERIKAVQSEILTWGPDDLLKVQGYIQAILDTDEYFEETQQ